MLYFWLRQHLWFTSVAIILVILLLPLWRAPRETHIPDRSLTVPVHGTTTVSQVFHSPYWLLAGIEIAANTSQIPLDTPVTLTLATYPDRVVIREYTGPLSAVASTPGSLAFSFRPLLLSAGTDYILTIATPSVPKQQALLLPHQQADELYAEGFYFIKDKQRKGDLGFTLRTYRPWGMRYAREIQVWLPYVVLSLLIIRSIYFLIRQRHGVGTSAAKPMVGGSMLSRRFVLPLLVWLTLTAVLMSVGIVRWSSGAFYDTAHDGLEAVEEVLQGNWAPFYEHYTGHQPLMDWLLAVVFLVGGISSYTLYSIGVGAAIATTWLLVLISRAHFGERAGWYAGAIASTSHWLLLVHREGTRVVLITPCLLLFIYALTRLYRSATSLARLGWAVIGGVALGSLGYIYGSAWALLPFLIAALVVMIVIAAWRRQAAHRAALTLCLAIGLLLLLPLLYYIIEAPERVFERPQATIGETRPTALAWRAARNLVPTSAGLLAILPRTAHPAWQENTAFGPGAWPIRFPIPLVAPVGFITFLAGIIFLITTFKHKQPWPRMVVLLAALALVGLLPNLITAGGQPHFRRTITAVAPLFLLMSWAAAQIDTTLRRRWRKLYWVWLLFFGFSLVYGPILYFGYAVSSNWYSGLYYPGHQEVAQVLFARVAAGQRVGVAGNRAHLKSLQFLALATPQAQKAFQMLPLPSAATFPTERLAEFDVLVVVSNTCAELPVPTFSEAPLIIDTRFGVEACFFDRPGLSPTLRTARVPLPVSGPLLPALLTRTTPLHSHDAFSGSIFTRW